jgi:hypothetical protein
MLYIIDKGETMLLDRQNPNTFSSATHRIPACKNLILSDKSKKKVKLFGKYEVMANHLNWADTKQIKHDRIMQELLEEHNQCDNFNTGNINTIEHNDIQEYFIEQGINHTTYS